MDAILVEWATVLLRWLHIIAGIAWIGSSFYFMHIDAALKPTPELPPGKGGETWEVHGGGFYQVRKWLVAPDRLPAELIWHKWEAYTTWGSGILLLAWIYYLGAELYLVDPAVRIMSPLAAAAIGCASLAAGWVVYDRLCRSPLAANDLALAAIGFALVVAAAWAYQQTYSARGAFIHTGALMATLMAGNVLLVIIPNQRKVIADLMAGRAPDPALGKAGKTRSTHNNYLTLPVLFLMASNHSPLTYASRYAWLLVALVLVAGALVRYFYNERHARRGNAWWAWVVAAAAMALAILVSMLGAPVGREALGLKAERVRTASAGIRPALPQDVDTIVTSRCSMCHAAEPVWNGIVAAPKGVRLDTAGEIVRNARAIRMQAVLTHAMPPNNITGMLPAERAVLARWLGIR